MKNYLITITVSILTILIYFALGSKELYRGLNGGFIPSLYYPIGIVILVVIQIILTKLILKTNSICTIATVIIAIAMFMGTTLFVRFLYEPIIRDFYKYDNSSFLEIGDYLKQKGNYVKLYSLLNEKDIKVNSIGKGYGKNPDLEEEFENQLTYSINDKYVIVVDWSKEDILILERLEIVEEECKKLLSKSLNVNENIIKKEYFDSCYGRFSVNSKKYGIYVYVENGKLAYKISK